VQAVDRPDVDDPGRFLDGARRLEQRQQEPGQVEHALHVQGQDALPRGLVELLQRRPPGRPGVVHEDVETVLPLGHGLGQAPALVLGGQVGGQGDALPHLRQLGRHFLAHVGLAGRDVDLRARLDEPPGDHQADAPGAPGDDGGLALDGEEIAHPGSLPHPATPHRTGPSLVARPAPADR
jgi:hypothetical protein